MKNNLNTYLAQMGYRRVNIISKDLKIYHYERYEPKFTHKTPQQVIQTLSDFKADKLNTQIKLVFCPITGNLLTTNNTTNNIKGIVVDQIYKDGFFCKAA